MTINDRISVAVFGLLMIACIYAAIFRPVYIVFATMCLAMIWAIVAEAKEDERNNQNK